MRRLLPILPLLLALGCGAGAPPPAPSPTPTAPHGVVTPPPGAYGDDPLATAPEQEPLPEGTRIRPAPEPTARPTPATAVPASSGPLSVAEIVLSRGIVDRRPDGVTDTFPDGAEVTCYTRIANPQGGLRTIQHRYYMGDVLKRTLSLKIRGTSWRTWSSKRVYGPGAWRVDVVDEGGAVLASKPFTVR